MEGDIDYDGLIFATLDGFVTHIASLCSTVISINTRLYKIKKTAINPSLSMLGLNMITAPMKGISQQATDNAFGMMRTFIRYSAGYWEGILSRDEDKLRQCVVELFEEFLKNVDSMDSYRESIIEILDPQILKREEKESIHGGILALIADSCTYIYNQRCRDGKMYHSSLDVEDILKRLADG